MCGDQGNPAAGALNQGVGSNRCSVRQPFDPAERDVKLLTQCDESGQNRFCRIGRSGGGLADMEEVCLVIGREEIGEGASDINSYCPTH